MRAYISVANKEGIEVLARNLLDKKYEIISTGNTYKYLTQKGIKATESSSITGFDELLGGKVKSLHPKIFAGILANADERLDKEIMAFDLVAVDLYPFESYMDKDVEIETLKREANEVEKLDIITTGKIPDDCDCLILSTLKEDITELERDKIIEYIKNGGEILLLCGPNIINANLTNFQAILNEYGLSIGNGVIFEGNSANMVSGYPDFIVEKVENTSVTKNLNMSMNICLIDAGKITFNEEKLEELGVEYETIATTTDSAFVRTDITQNSISRTEKDGEQEICTIGAVATKTINEEKTSKLVVFSNELFAMDMPIPINGYTMYTVNLYNNSDLILNSISYLNEREDTITIRKDNEQVTYTVTEQQNLIINYKQH